MAGINDVTGVCVGGVLGHIICTGLAGTKNHTKISARAASISIVLNMVVSNKVVLNKVLNVLF
jgi:riboflavin synthase